MAVLVTSLATHVGGRRRLRRRDASGIRALRPALSAGRVHDHRHTEQADEAAPDVVEVGPDAIPPTHHGSPARHQRHTR
jgi:hypothetical protein